MSKIIEVSTQDNNLILINTAYIIKIENGHKHGAVIIYDNGGQKEEIKTEKNYNELKDLIQN